MHHTTIWKMNVFYIQYVCSSSVKGNMWHSVGFEECLGLSYILLL